MRPSLIKFYHKAHLGARILTGHMSKIYYWPTLANEVWVDCNACPACMVAKPSKMLGKALVPEAKMSEILPMEEVSIDFFHTSKGEMLAFVD